MMSLQPPLCLTWRDTLLSLSHLGELQKVDTDAAEIIQNKVAITTEFTIAFTDNLFVLAASL